MVLLTVVLRVIHLLEFLALFHLVLFAQLLALLVDPIDANKSLLAIRGRSLTFAPLRNFLSLLQRLLLSFLPSGLFF